MSDQVENFSFVITMSCPDKAGIVAATTGCLADQGCFIIEAAHFADTSAQTFFGRIVFRLTRNQISIDGVEAAFSVVAQKFRMAWVLRDQAKKKRVLLMVSKFGHCLNDLLHRYRTHALPMEVSAVVSNHTAMQSLADWHSVDFHHLPITPETKFDQEARLREIISETESDLIVLARYMQILTPEFSREFFPRVINIHHSFLPGFKGARPYHQAYERGVKLIGATAHFVTEDLDEGPIIEQSVERVDHTYTPDQLVAVGRDIENVVLARGLQAVLEDRVLLNGIRTVIF